MSDSFNHDLLSDDLFRNRIAAALRELDQPESDADIAAALDAIDAEPLSDEAQQRIMRQVQRSIAATDIVSGTALAAGHVGNTKTARPVASRDYSWHIKQQPKAIGK